MADIPENFMEYVQHHERVWGHDAYPNRPKLQQILDAPVVVFWQDIGPENIQNRRFHVTLHDKLDEIEDFISKALQRTHSELLDERIHHIFKRGKRREQLEVLKDKPHMLISYTGPLVFIQLFELYIV